MIRAFCIVAAVVSGLLAATSFPAAPQELSLVTGIFKNINSVTIYGQGAYLAESPELTTEGSNCKGFGICGMGSEVLITLASPNEAVIELGLGTSFMRGFRAREQTLDLRGSVRSFPTVTGYGTWSSLFGSELAEPYVGLGFGISDLWNVQAYDTARREYTLKGQTFDYGATAGMYLNIPLLPGLFVEGSYRRRRFGSLDWTFPGAAQEKLPDGWPRELDLSGWSLSAGWQFDLRDRKSGPPSLQGTWMLTRVNGQQPPATLTQGSGERWELMTGFASFAADSTYTLNTVKRRSAVAPDGKVTDVSEPVAVVEDGRYLEQDRQLTPEGGGVPYTFVRSGDEIIVSHPGLRHQIVLKKVSP